MTDFLTPTELASLGLQMCGENVLISRHALLLNPQWISVASHARIDAFSIVSAGPDGVSIGQYAHAAAAAKIYGFGGRVTLGDFTGMSANSTIYTANDDWSGESLMHPTIPTEFRNPSCGAVTFETFAAIGCEAVILPGVTLHEGAAAGALSVVRHSVAAGEIVGGNPAVVLGRRNLVRMRELAEQLRSVP